MLCWQPYWMGHRQHPNLQWIDDDDDDDDDDDEEEEEEGEKKKEEEGKEICLVSRKPLLLRV